jgi:hypothetical protein
MTHLLLHKTPNSVSSEPGAAHFVSPIKAPALIIFDEYGGEELSGLVILVVLAGIILVERVVV